MGTFLLLSLGLVVLHRQFVGHAHCLAGQMQREPELWNHTRNAPQVADDVVLFISIVEMASFGESLRGGVLEQPRALGSSQGNKPSGTAGNITVHGPGFSVASSNRTALDPASGRPASSPDRHGPAGEVLATYRFALGRGLLFMRPSIRDGHKFKVYNITLPEPCLAPSRMIRDVLRLFDAFDTVVINELAYTLVSRGFLERTEGSDGIDSWSWTQ